MCNVVHNIQPRDAALIEEIHRMRFLLAKNRHQHVGTGHFFLSRRLHVQDRALDHPLEALRGLGIRVRVGRQARRVLVDEVGQDSAQFLEVDAARLQYLGRRRVVEHREQEVLDGNELMLLLPGFDKSHVEGDFQFLRNHMTCLSRHPQCPPVTVRPPRACAAWQTANAQVSSIVHCSGCWYFRAISMT